MRHALKLVLFFLLASYLVPALAFDNRLPNAISRGDSGQVEELMAEGVDPDQPISQSTDQSALMFASYTRKTEIANILIANGADVNYRSSNGSNALISAIKGGSIDIVNILIPKSKDKDADIAGTVNWVNTNGQVLLINLLRRGYKTDELRKEMMQFMLTNGANTNLQDKTGSTALMAAVTTGDLAIVNMFLEHDPDLEVKNTGGYNALMIALVNRKADMAIVNALIEKGAKLDAIDFTSQSGIGDTLLTNAAESERPDKIEFMLNNGAKVNATNKRGYTPLMIAAKQGNAKVVKLLLSHKADVHIKASDGQNAYRESLAGGDPEVMKMLEDKGAHL